MKRILFPTILLLFGLIQSSRAQTVLTLDSVKRLALSESKTLATARLSIDKADNVHRAARTQYLPKISVVGGYMHTGDELHLLSSAQRNSLSGMGTTFSQQIAGELQQAAGEILTRYPDLAPLLQQAQDKLPALAAGMNAVGKDISDAFRTDTRNLTAAAIILAQPLYMGGKIRAYDRLTEHSRRLAAEQLREAEHNVLLEAEQAYWQVVSLAAKKRLAQSYREVLAELYDDVQKMVEQGLATRANALSVSVKLGEAEMTLTKVDDGLTLSRMLLCRLCGFPLDTDLRPAEEASGDITTEGERPVPDIAAALTRRPELQQLEAVEAICRDKVRIERSALLPQLSLTGGYLVSNPNVLNGFQKNFRGTWSVGLVLQLPVWHWGETRYKVRAAEAEARMTGLRRLDAQEKVELQLRQETLRLKEADRKLALSRDNLAEADENLRVARIGFREGVISTSDVLAATASWLRAHSDLTDAQIDVRLSQATLRKAMGL